MDPYDTRPSSFPEILVGGLIFSSTLTGRIACLCLELAYESRSATESAGLIYAPPMVEIAKKIAFSKIAKRKLNAINCELRAAAQPIQGGITTQHELLGLRELGISSTVLMKKINESAFGESMSILSRLKTLANGFGGLVGEAVVFTGSVENSPYDLEPSDLKFFQGEIAKLVGQNLEGPTRRGLKIR